MKLVCDCGYVISKFEVWILKDTQDFEARKLFIGSCPVHHRPVVSIFEKRILDGVVFKKENIISNDAVKILNKEYKNLLHKYKRVKSNCLNGFVYGINKECKDRKGNIIKIEQYSADFKGTKNLIKIMDVEPPHPQSLCECTHFHTAHTSPVQIVSLKGRGKKS